MAFDGIAVRAVTQELNKKLSGGKLEKVYQPENDELIFHIHSKEGNFKLYLSCNSSSARINLITESVPNPPAPMTFCMLLRKHIQGGRITEITQKECERIVEIPFETVNELGFSVSKKLIIEIMGKHSNIILVDLESNKIIDSIKRISIDVNRIRQILPGKLYEYPPVQNKIPFDTVTLQEIETLCLCTPNKLPKALLNGIQGISPIMAEQLTYGLSISSEIPYTPEEVKRTAQIVYTNLCKILSNLKIGNVCPRVYLNTEGNPVDFHVMPIQALEGVYETRPFEEVSGAIEFFYSHRASSNRIRQKSTDLEKAVKTHLDKLYLKKQRLSEELLKAENSEDYRLFGELLTANLHLFKAGDSQVTVINYYDGKELTIPLDKKISPSKNAQHYFKKYGKSKTAIKEKAIQLEETAEDLNYLESISVFIKNADGLEEVEEIRSELIEAGYLKKRKVYGKPAKTKPAPKPYTTSDGFRVLVGRNNKENDHLTFKLASSKDMWFHTKDIPGSHVILFTEGKDITETAIFEGAAIAAYHSKGRDSENVPVDYVQVKYVKKPAGAKPGMVIFTNNRTVYVNPKLPQVQV
ncbi:Rqc2 family fibronectin-binding protein [Aminipila luticellarii]|uniref:Rqc2 homolog RqcH n=1 Tax=Aminipila luticellarii TaxID=2507160 RepID=A0A410PW41_9FIRM|nr:NFACT RNA binding domain-containing protein [Aminipila luticellarii]QAT43147.1 fibronectin/fibrinogen-binding protein [Aminipila luticellarii]